MTKEKNKRASLYTIQLPVELRTVLDEQADRHGLSVSNILISGGWSEVERLRDMPATIRRGPAKK